MTQRFQPPRELSRCVSALHCLCLTPARAHSCSQTFPPCGSSALKCLHARAPGCTPKKKKKGFNYRRREPIRSLNLTWLFINQNTRCLRQRRIGGQLRSQPAAGASQQLLESSQDHEGQQQRSSRVNAGAAAQLSPRCPHIPSTQYIFGRPQTMKLPDPKAHLWVRSLPQGRGFAQAGPYRSRSSCLHHRKPQDSQHRKISAGFGYLSTCICAGACERFYLSWVRIQ